MTDDEVRGRLREAARSHSPDRARMLARVERGMAEEQHPAVPPPMGLSGRVRIAGATAAVVAVLALGGYAVAAMGHDEDDATGVAAPPATPSAPAGTGDGRLWADGSVDPHSNSYWAQSNVTVQNAGELTSLTVELRIARTGGVESTGNWRTRPAADFDFSVREERDALVYRWVLRPGRTVPPGRHVFAGQYNHAEGGRDAGGDTYTVRTGASGEPAEADGEFTPARR
ncbi:hypothetical protein [Streptomyces peucetius]|uniref:Uncharacterized protein n=1 Tax=Streptomyces peucetius TaxID=1950 RepID=A0ABY6IIV1_STRPE|nr:hypothetical protein [Streptomyces peucetius]UYQ65827.1 hypothetical protein OGH68_33160 [Streptomyces peucetius]